MVKFVSDEYMQSFIKWIKDNFITIEQHEQDLANLRAELLGVPKLSKTISQGIDTGRIITENDDTDGKKELIEELPYDQYMNDSNNPELGRGGSINVATKSADTSAWAEINQSIAGQWNDMIGGKNGNSKT